MKNVFAQVDIGSTFGSPYGQTKGVADLLSIVLSGGLVIAGIILLFLFVGGGVQMIAGAGNSDPKATAGGKQAVTWALAGFLIVFASFWLIRFLEVVTGYEFLTNPLFNIGGGGTVTPTLPISK